MAYTLKTSGIATNLVACVGVDDDNTIKDFKGNAISLDTGVAASVATGSWKGTARKYFVTTANGSFNFNGVRWNATQPTVAGDDSDGQSVFVALHANNASNDDASMVLIGTGIGNRTGLFVNSSTKASYNPGGGTQAVSTTTIPTDNSTKFSIGSNYKGGGGSGGSEIFYGLESGSLASDGTAAYDGGFGGSRSIYAIGGTDGWGKNPCSPYIVCVFDKQLSLAEMQSLHDDWFGTLFDAAGTTQNLSGSACTGGVGSQSPGHSIGL